MSIRTCLLSFLLWVGPTFGAYSQCIDSLVTMKRHSSNSLFHHLGQASRQPAFEQDNYWIWGSSVIKGKDGKYHMYVSRFPKSLPFHPGWMVASEIVHAVADVVEGPYQFSDVALPPRGPQYWDGRSTHNPRILYHDNKYYLIYI